MEGSVADASHADGEHDMVRPWGDNTKLSSLVIGRVRARTHVQVGAGETVGDGLVRLLYALRLSAIRTLLTTICMNALELASASGTPGWALQPPPQYRPNSLCRIDTHCLRSKKA